MRVAFHAGQLLQPVPGGIGRYEIALLWRLPNFGVDPIAFAAGARPDGVNPDVPWIDLGRPAGSARYELWHRLRLPVVRVDGDLVHAPSLAVPPVRGRPLVVTAHDVAFLRVPEVTTKRGVAFHTRGLALARRHADVVIVPSRFTGDELEREGFDRDRLVVVPLGVSAPEVRDDAEVDATIAAYGVQPPYVLTVGTVEPRKDVGTIVQAVERLRRSQPDLTLVVAGPRGWGTVAGLDRSFVRMLGALPWRVLDAVYRRASAFCVASVYEGFGLPTVEAAARGVPTVVSTGSALEEVMRDAALMFAPRDLDACTACLERVLADGSERDALVAAARKRAAELTWEGCAEGHARAYQLALERARP